MSGKVEGDGTQIVGLAEAILRGEDVVYSFYVSQETFLFLEANLGHRSYKIFGGANHDVSQSVIDRWGFNPPMRKSGDKYMYRIGLNYFEVNYIGDFLCEVLDVESPGGKFVENALNAFDETHDSFIRAGGEENVELRGKLDSLKNKRAVG